MLGNNPVRRNIQNFEFTATSCCIYRINSLFDPSRIRNTGQLCFRTRSDHGAVISFIVALYLYPDAPEEGKPLELGFHCILFYTRAFLQTECHGPASACPGL